MQAQILYKSEFVHISYGNWICRHRPHTSQAKSEYRTCAHILYELNMQTQSYITCAHISMKLNIQA